MFTFYHIMTSYSRNFVLSRCFWWKSVDSRLQISRHCQNQSHRSNGFPLNSSTWNTLKSLGLLRRYRGKHSTRDLSENLRQRPIIPWISTFSSTQLDMRNQRSGSTSLASTLVNRSRRQTGGGVNSSNLLIPPRIPFVPQVSKSAKLCLVNTRSICNKASLLNDFVIENDIDLLCISETWLKSNANILNNQLK